MIGTDVADHRPENTKPEIVSRQHLNPEHTDHQNQGEVKQHYKTTIDTEKRWTSTHTDHESQGRQDQRLERATRESGLGHSRNTGSINHQTRAEKSRSTKSVGNRVESAHAPATADID